MATIAEIYNSFQAFDLDDAVFRAMDASSEGLTELNKEQLLSGQNANGDRVGQYRNELYAIEKNRMNPKAGFGNVDLRLTGDFFNRMNTNVLSNSTVTSSNDDKAAELEKKYGEDIYGLNTTFKAPFRDNYLAPAFANAFQLLTGLKFGSV
jgi:hypothetical protein